jgi:hypothetical protein
MRVLDPESKALVRDPCRVKTSREGIELTARVAESQGGAGGGEVAVAASSYGLAMTVR